LSCKFQTNLAGPEELRMELAGLGSIPPYALYCYMSNEAYTTCAIYCLGAMRWQITAQRLCVLEHRPLLSELLYDSTIWKGQEAGERVKSGNY